MSNVGPLVEAGATQRFLFAKPRLVELQDMGKRWMNHLYYEQYGKPKNPVPIMPMYRDPEQKTEIEASADCLYEILPVLRTMTTPGCKIVLLFTSEEIIDHIEQTDTIRNRMVQCLAGLEYELGTYDWSEIEEKVL